VSEYSTNYIYGDSVEEIAAQVRERFGPNAIYPTPAIDTVTKKRLLNVKDIKVRASEPAPAIEPTRLQSPKNESPKAPIIGMKGRIRQLFEFLKEATQMRYRPVRSLEAQEKTIWLSRLPNHPTLQIIRPTKSEEGLQIPEQLVRVRRPKLTHCPSPPESLQGWLMTGWDDPKKQPSVAESLNRNEPDRQTTTQRFDADPIRVSDFKHWLVSRAAWIGPELAAREAMKTFEDFYGLYTAIEKGGEDLELMIADGHLLWEAVSDNEVSPVIVQHPVLLKRVELTFDPKVPEFSVREGDRDTELYKSLFLDLKGVQHSSIKARVMELETVGFHPMGYEDTDAFLRSLIQSLAPLKGEYLEKIPADRPNSTPRLYRDCVLVLRKRVSGIANAVDKILEDIDKQVVFPPALAQVTGTVEEWKVQEAGMVAQDVDRPAIVHSEEDILLAKEANNEQLQIIRKLERSGTVLVQGPPGTGKTHTIGNLIGHLLAQGKSILVTAQTAKALRVLHDKVPEVLRPLAVSVLGSDQSARRQLESSIGSITERLTSDSVESLMEKARLGDEARRRLLHREKELKDKLRRALENEYRELEVGTRHSSPSEAARYVAENSDMHSWIPAPVKLGADLTLADSQIGRVYNLGQMYTPAEEHDSRFTLPDLGTLPTEKQFEMMVSEYQAILTADLTLGSHRWQGDTKPSESLTKILEDLGHEFSEQLRAQAWRPYAITDGIHGGADRAIWEKLIQAVESAVEANRRHSIYLHHRASAGDKLNLQRTIAVAGEIGAHLDSGKGLGFLQLATRSEWRTLIRSARVSSGQPTHREHFQAVAAYAELLKLREELGVHWDHLVGSRSDHSFGSLGQEPELSCRALLPEIQRCLDWYQAVWGPLAERLRAESLAFDELLAGVPRAASQVAEYRAIEDLVTQSLADLIRAEIGRRRLKECEAGFLALQSLSSLADDPGSGSIARIISALRSLDINAYRNALDYVRRLQVVRPLVRERDELTEKLRLVAPGWVDQILLRMGPHGANQTPGDIGKAWIWRQFHDELLERDKLDAHELQAEVDKVRATLREVTKALIDSKAWGRQLERLESNHSVRQALVGWLDTTKKLFHTRQVERRHSLQVSARKLMKECVSAVPVWIMPISIVAESFDPGTTKFDVVILDEASQADLNGLIPLYMAKQVVVVGDHEQVTPLGVGKAHATIDNLRQAMLHDIPNSHLFDNMSSIYDIGRQSFGDAIRLVEHFRCVPEIIAFSNQLSYEGKIKPLRESNSTVIKPACVSVRVNGLRERDTNDVEARRIIDLIKAMIVHPKYVDKTIGVISMIGETQAIAIQTLLLKEISSIEINKRRIQAGISGEFQGDERDIILLSMVENAPIDGEGLLRTVGDGAFESTKKRYNVAASRAKDQLWVIHSFDPDLHLKPQDIRMKLLQHVKDPSATIRAFGQEAGKTESPFEKEVLKRLTGAGFRVKTQWHVGYYRIDMVIEGTGKRLAVECDGDRYHPLDKLAEDIERQTILERLGWTFVRIRGSVFYRNPDNAMKPVFQKLEDMDIQPEGPEIQASWQDMSLVHELNALIAEDVNATDSIDRGDEDLEIEGLDSSIGSLPDIDSFQWDLDGTLTLSDFLRQLSKLSGFQRFGRNIRKRLNQQVDDLVQTGKVYRNGDVLVRR